MNYEVCDEAYLEGIQQTSTQSLSLDKEVFHIIGRPDEVWNFRYYLSLYPKTKEFYDLIARKGGNFEKKVNSPNITCVIIGSKPSKNTLKRFEGKVKLIRAENAYNWLRQQEDINQDCRAFEELYHVSEDTKLRPYQQDLKNRVFNIWRSFHNVMLQLPTGTGKTVLFTSIINDLTKVEGTKIIILAHRKELIDQISEHLSHYKIEHGLIVSGRMRK